MNRYDDIIHLPHHTSATRKRMSMTERAAQFGAFKALRGHEDALHETARLTETKPLLDEDEKIRLNHVLRQLEGMTEKKPVITLTYFKPDEKKQGGACITLTGELNKIKEYEQLVVLQDGREIPVEDILAIESDWLFLEHEHV